MSRLILAVLSVIAFMAVAPMAIEIAAKLMQLYVHYIEWVIR